MLCLEISLIQTTQCLQPLQQFPSNIRFTIPWPATLKVWILLNLLLISIYSPFHSGLSLTYLRYFHGSLGKFYMLQTICEKFEQKLKAVQVKRLIVYFLRYYKLYLSCPKVSFGLPPFRSFESKTSMSLPV